MNKTYSLNLLLLICTSFLLMAIAPPKVKWQTLAPPEGKFKMKFPGEPEVETSELEGGKLFKYSITIEGNTYFASFILHNNPLTNHQDLAQTSVDAFGENVKAKKDGQEAWSVKKHEGLLATYAMSDPAIIIEYRVVLIGQHQYQLVVFGSKDDFPRKEANTFFNSFKRLK